MKLCQVFVNQVNIIAYFNRYDWLCHLATNYNNLYVGIKKVIKPIILVKICYNIDKITSWPQLISNLLVMPACCNAASD